MLALQLAEIKINRLCKELEELWNKHSDMDIYDLWYEQLELKKVVEKRLALLASRQQGALREE